MSFFNAIKKYFIRKPSLQESFTWKYFNIDEELVKEIKDIYLKNLKEDVSQYTFFQVLRLNIPDIMGHKVVGAGLVYSPGNHTSKFSHKDPMVDGASAFALNIPLANCDNSVTTLYKSRKSPMFTFYGTRIAEIAKVTDCDKVTSYTLDSPILFNTQILHAVDNFSAHPRLAISLRFDKDPIEWIGVH